MKESALAARFVNLFVPIVLSLLMRKSRYVRLMRLCVRAVVLALAVALVML